MSEAARQISVLIIDDSPSDRRIYHRFLKNFGWTITDATSGKDGLIACQSSPFDCIVLDYRMPGDNGVSFIPSLRAITDAPILLLTGEPDPLIVSEAFRHGADGYLSKDFVSSENLKQKIELLMSSR